MPRLSQTFKKLLRDTLKEQKLVFRDAAHRTGFSHTTIRNWASGEVPSDPQFVRELADGLKTPRVPLLEAAEYRPNEEDIRHDLEHYGTGSPQGQASHGITDAEQSEVYRALRRLGGRVSVVRISNIGEGIPVEYQFRYRCTGDEGLQEFPQGTVLDFIEATTAKVGQWVLVEDHEDFHLRIYRGPSTGRVVGVLTYRAVPVDEAIPEVLIQ